MGKYANLIMIQAKIAYCNGIPGQYTDTLRTFVTPLVAFSIHISKSYSQNDLKN